MSGKYVVFERDQFFALMGELGLPPYFERPHVIGDQGESAGQNWEVPPIAEYVEARVKATELKDVVVIPNSDEASGKTVIVVDFAEQENSMALGILIQKAQAVFKDVRFTEVRIRLANGDAANAIVQMLEATFKIEKN